MAWVLCAERCSPRRDVVVSSQLLLIPHPVLCRLIKVQLQ